MTSELAELYQELLLDHGRRPRNFGPLPQPDFSARGINPLCGDEVTVYIRMQGDVIQALSFEGTGCVISSASASLMTAALQGKTRKEAMELFTRFHTLITEGPGGETELATLGKLAALSGVSAFPARVKCASLAWHTLRSALEGGGLAISTE